MDTVVDGYTLIAETSMSSMIMRVSAASTLQPARCGDGNGEKTG
jgi:hypothetical protein